MQTTKWITLGMSTLCLVAVAAVVNSQHLYYMAAILLTLPGISYALGWFALRGLEFTRELPPAVWEGDESRFVYVVKNPTRLPRYFLAVREPLPNWIRPMETEPPLFNVAAFDTARVVFPVQFHKRGVYHVQAFEMAATDPLGVFAFSRRIPCEGEIVVYPRPENLGALTLSGAERYGLQEFTRMALRGSSVEPDGVREYAPGDPLRRIHWRQTARTGKLSVIEFEESQAVNLVIALDLQRGKEAGQGVDTTLEYAVRLAASLAQQAVQQGASVRLLLPDDLPESMLSALSCAMVSQSGRGQQQLYFILDALARVEAESRQSVSALVQSATGSLMPGTTLLVLTSNPDRALPAVLARYTATGANIGVVYIDPTTFPNGRDRATISERQRFCAELLAVQARPFVLKFNETHAIAPEAVADADIRSSD